MKKWQVLKAFVHGDGNLLTNYPELQEALVWVYFHSHHPEFNTVECWGPLNNAAPPLTTAMTGGSRVWAEQVMISPEKSCIENCTCCFPSISLIPRSKNHVAHEENFHKNRNLLRGPQLMM